MQFWDLKERKCNFKLGKKKVKWFSAKVLDPKPKETNKKFLYNYNLDSCVN